MIYGYARVSTDGQSVEAQIAALTAAGAGKIFREVASGAKTDRAQLRRVLDQLDAGDVLMVTRLDRLARSTRDLLNTLAAIAGKQAGFRSLGDAWADTTTPHGRLMLTVLGGLAEFERAPTRQGARRQAGEARRLLDSIDTTTLVGLRDRALIGVMTFAFARIGAVVAMRVEDYYPEGKRWWVRLHEKGGKRHEMPTHHKLEAYLDEYVLAAGIRDEAKGPLFRSATGKTGVLTTTPMHRVDAYRMVRRRAVEAGFKQKLGCHVFRATGITAYLEAGGTLENAQAMAAHESPRTTKLYDRTSDAITLDEVERITI